MSATPQELGKKLEELYSWKDNTTGLHRGEKKSHLSKESKEILTKINSLPLSTETSAKEKAYIFYLQGKALNIFEDEYDKEAENALSKAIKLDPALVDAWNGLGESYWKKGDLLSSKNCFSGVLSQRNAVNKVSLRCLSMVLRQLGADANEKKENIEESVSKAKEAVALDLKDATSWYILGNAHLTRFFNVSDNKQRLPDLEAALRAYAQAEAAAGGSSPNADLHYNRAVLLTFKEDYATAIEGYTKASSIDPDWNLPKEMLTKYVHSSVQQKGPLKPKKISILAKDASSVRYSAQPLSKIHFSQLREGKNAGVLCVKIGALLSPPGAAPPAVICVDEKGGVGTVSLYGIDPQKGVQPGDSLGIPNPIVKKVDVSVHTKNYSQVEVNGYPFNKDLYASPSLTLSVDAKVTPAKSNEGNKSTTKAK